MHGKMTKRMIEWEMVKEEIGPQKPTPKRNSLPWMISQLALPHLNATSDVNPQQMYL